MSNPTQELHTERQAPKRSTVEKSAVGAILLHCPAVRFPPARMMPVKLMRLKYSVFRWKRLFIIGATATVTHCAAYCICEEGGENKKKNSQVQSLLERQAAGFTRWTSSVSSAVVLAQAELRKLET